MPARLRTEDVCNLFRREEVVGPLLSPAVRVLAAVKAAVRGLELPQAVIEGLLGDLAPERHVPLLPGFGITQGQQGVIVERLFKMRL